MGGGAGFGAAADVGAGMLAPRAFDVAPGVGDAFADGGATVVWLHAPSKAVSVMSRVQVLAFFTCPSPSD